MEIRKIGWTIALAALLSLVTVGGIASAEEESLLVRYLGMDELSAILKVEEVLAEGSEFKFEVKPAYDLDSYTLLRVQIIPMEKKDPEEVLKEAVRLLREAGKELQKEGLGILGVARERYVAGVIQMGATVKARMGFAWGSLPKGHVVAEEFGTTRGNWGYDRLDVEEVHARGMNRATPISSLPLALGTLGLGAVAAAVTVKKRRKELLLFLLLAVVPFATAGCGGAPLFLPPIATGSGVHVWVHDSGVMVEWIGHPWDPAMVGEGHPDLPNVVQGMTWLPPGFPAVCADVASPFSDTVACDDDYRFDNAFPFSGDGVGLQPYGSDSAGHGTVVAGIIGAAAGQEPFQPKPNRPVRGKGMIGIAPNAVIHPVKACSALGYCYYPDIIAGFKYILGTLTTGTDVSDMANSGLTGKDVVNMSWGGVAPCEPPLPGADETDPATWTDGHVRYLLQQLQQRGAVLVAAAGNEYTDAPGPEGNIIWPANCPETIAVTASNVVDGTSYFSSVGPEAELIAPGSDIFSTCIHNPTIGAQWYGYEPLMPCTQAEEEQSGWYNYGDEKLTHEGFWFGTSFSAPHVSGVAALLLEAGYTDPRARMAATAENIGPVDCDNLIAAGSIPGCSWAQGFGLVDAENAVLGTTNGDN